MILIILLEIVFFYVFPPFSYPEVTMAMLIGGALIIYTIWRNPNLKIMDERTKLISEKASVRTLQTMMIIFLVVGFLIASMGFFLHYPEIYTEAFSIFSDIAIILLIYLVFFIYYTIKYGM